MKTDPAKLLLAAALFAGVASLGSAQAVNATVNTATGAAANAAAATQNAAANAAGSAAVSGSPAAGVNASANATTGAAMQTAVANDSASIGMRKEAAASANSSDLTMRIQSTTFAQRDQLTSDVQGRLDASASNMASLEAKAAQSGDKARVAFAKDAKEVRSHEKAVRKDLEAAAKADSEKAWTKAQSKLSNDYSAYVEAQARAEASANGRY